MKIFVTGGAGYIGSHFLEAFLASPFAHDARVWVVDDLSGGHPEFIDALRVQAKERGVREFHFDRKSLLDEEFLQRHVKSIDPDIVFHFAGKISVAESVRDPDYYFAGNVRTTKNLLHALSTTSCRNLVFSSTAAVYQPSFDQKPLQEDSPLGPSSPYGENKLQVENMLDHAARAWGLRSVIFRYFNAAGASETGRIGEWHEPETHLIPLLLSQGTNDAADDAAPKFKVYGSDYPTRDGTCVRDYIHVADLASAHLLAIDYLATQTGKAPSEERPKAEVFNLGTNRGITVLEMLHAASDVLGKKIPFELAPRRDGDSAVLVAAADKAREKLNWSPDHSDLEKILKSALRWEQTLQKIRIK
jgi:UDP-glucose 4-epimerase